MARMKIRDIFQLCVSGAVWLIAAGVAQADPNCASSAASTDVSTAALEAAVSEPHTALSFRQLAAIQTLLDRAHFSCGCIDGVWGPHTHEALAAWQEARGLAATGVPDAPTLAALGPLDRAFTHYTVTADDHAALAPLPASWRDKANMPTLGYETILETVAEKQHASEAALRRLNPDVAWPNPPTGTRLTVPHPAARTPPPAARITVSLSAKRIRAFDAAGHVLVFFPCSIAKDEAKRPVGELHITVCARHPNYVFDPAVFTESEEARAGKGRLMIPPGPNNPVGAAWIGLDRPGYGIHGTPAPEDIGKTESHGCFRLANWNALMLLDMVAVGLPVLVEP